MTGTANGTAVHAQPWPFVPLVPSGPVVPWPRAAIPQPPPGARLLPLTAVRRSDTTTAAGSDTATTPRAARWRPRWPAVDGDTVITWSMTGVAAAVILFAAIVSYSHIHALATAHGEDSTQSHLLPLSIDGMIAEASLVMLFAARHKGVATPGLARVMLWSGIVATLAANAVVALPASWISPVANAVVGAVLSAWPAAAFIGSVELVMLLVRAVRAVASSGDTDSDTEDDSDDDTEPTKTTGQGGGGGGKKPPVTRRRRTTRDPVKAAIKKGWDDDKIIAKLSVTKRTVQRHRAEIKAEENATGAPS
ncbi:MAG TPA: DUF2637 domain-containing protein [Trebonia sp.]|nr:DUF2637 domain-containing protein [Trebonia sp.]